MSLLIVVISWPEDPDRPHEYYGPFESEEKRDAWVADSQDAAALGWRLLQDASYLLTRLDTPPDPTELIQDGARFTNAD